MTEKDFEMVNIDTFYNCFIYIVQTEFDKKLRAIGDDGEQYRRS
jgi:hypothetical protein